MRVSPGLASLNPQFDRMVRATVPGMAHFAGTGPKNKCCGDCVHLVPRGSMGYGCDLFYKRMRRWLDEEIPRQTKSCKYFEQRRLPHGTRPSHRPRAGGSSGHEQASQRLRPEQGPEGVLDKERQ